MDRPTRNTIAAALHQTNTPVSTVQQHCGERENGLEKPPRQHEQEPHQPPLRGVAAHGAPPEHEVEGEGGGAGDEAREEREEEEGEVEESLEGEELREDAEGGVVGEGAGAGGAAAARHCVCVWSVWVVGGYGGIAGWLRWSVGRSGGCRARVWLVFVGGFSVVLGYSVVVGLVEGFRGEARTWVTYDVQQTGPWCCR